ncbi:hypothetical protein [Clostridium lundense]|uniref:hypothetical protein n=1 Tax=Clostridium lundense TaxID=319475 RepID=UPI000486A4A7|nr:hypothetical protein [Clostridium lundense]
MFIELMKGIGIFYYWTWFLWPFIFVFALVHAISSMIKDEKASSKNSSIVASISLLIILAGIVSPAFN